MQTSSLKIGTTLKSPTQEYRIEKILGAGSFGITYLATSKVKYGNVSFVVKFAIKEHFMESCYRDEDGVYVHCTPTSQKNVELSRKDFLNEAKRLQNICQYSKNIVHVNEAFEANGTAYYVMEYLDGGSPKSMDERSAVKLILQIADAVQILHNHKLLHLDIKPDNIVLKTAADGSSYPVLIDFGITKHFDKRGKPTSSPNAKGISLGYAPIEQNDVIQKFSPTLDIYALGATLLYLLTGKNPPSSVKLIDASQKTLKEFIPASVSNSTREAILRAMYPNKQERTQTVNAFIKSLSRLVENENTSPRSTTKTEPLKKKSKTKPSYSTKSTNKEKISNTALSFSIISCLIGLWFFDKSILYNGILCLIGIGLDFALCYYLSKAFKIKSVVLYILSILVFIIIAYFINATIILYTILAILPIILLMFFALISKNIYRWVLTILLGCIAAILGYFGIINNHQSNDELKGIGKQNNVQNVEELSTGDKIRLLKLYDVIKKFNFDRAIVSKDGKYGVIDTRGRLVIPCDYFYIQDFQDSLSIVSKLVTKYKGKVKHEYAVLNVDGDTIVPFGKYSYIGHYNFGLAPAKKNNEKYVFIDKYGIEKHNRSYFFADTYNDGLAYVVLNDGKMGYVDVEGKFIQPIQDAYYKDFLKSDKAVREEYRYSNFSEGVAAISVFSYKETQFVSSEQYYCYINNQGGKLFELPDYLSFPSEFSNGLAKVKNTRNSKYGFIDKNGHVKLDFQYIDATKFQNGYAWVWNGTVDSNKERTVINIDKAALINTKGEFTTGFNFSPADNYNGFAVVKTKENFVGSNHDSDRVSLIDEYGIALISSKDGIGAINTNGKIIVPCEYELVNVSGFGLIQAHKNGTIYVYDLNGHLL